MYVCVGGWSNLSNRRSATIISHIMKVVRTASPTYIAMVNFPAADIITA